MVEGAEPGHMPDLPVLRFKVIGVELPIVKQFATVRAAIVVLAPAVDSNNEIAAE